MRLFRKFLFGNARRAGMDRDGGQAMIESALVLPIYVLLIIGIIDFGTRSHTLSRMAMAARYGAWLGAHDRYGGIEDGVKSFFPANAPVAVSKSQKEMSLDYHNALIDYMQFAYTCGYTGHSLKKNVSVTLTHTRSKLNIAPPGPSAGLEFLFSSITDYSITAVAPDTDNWKTLDFLTVCWFFLASGAWLDIILDIGMGKILDGLFGKFGEVLGPVLKDIMNEIIGRLKNIPALKCD